MKDNNLSKNILLIITFQLQWVFFWCVTTTVERRLGTEIGPLDDRVTDNMIIMNSCWYLIYYRINMYDVYDNQ